MRLSRPVAALIGVLTLLPAVYMVYFAVSLFSMFGAVSAGTRADPQTAERSFRILMTMHFSVMALTFLLMAFYIVHVFKCPVFADNRRVLWVLVIFFGSFIGMFLYWFLNIWRIPSPALPPVLSQSPAAGGPAAT